MGGTADDGRYGYWFPLVLLGFGLLALLGWDSVRPAGDFGWFAYTPASADSVIAVDGGVNTAVPLLVSTPVRDWAWLVLVTVWLVGTVAWYAVRARRAGRRVRGHVAVAVGASAAVWGGHVVAGIGDLVPSVGLPLILLGVLAGVYHRLDQRRRTAAVIGAVCLGTGVAVVLDAWSPGLLAPVLIACGLLALARFERSRLVAMVAVVVLVGLVVLPDGTLRMLVPAVVVLVAALSALVRRAGAA